MLRAAGGEGQGCQGISLADPKPLAVTAVTLADPRPLAVTVVALKAGRRQQVGESSPEAQEVRQDRRRKRIGLRQAGIWASELRQRQSF